MSKFHRIAGAVVASSLAGMVMLAPVAHADTATPSNPVAPIVQTAETFLGAASANGLDLTLDGQTVTIGAGLSKLTSQLLTSAAGTAVMSVLGTTQSSAQLSGNKDASVVDGPHCNPVIPLVVLQINNACTSSATTMTNGLGRATTINSVDSINLTLNSLLSAVPLGQQLTQTLQNVVNQLNLPVQLNPVTDTVGKVLNDVLNTPTAQLSIGSSISDVVTQADKIVSTGVAKGGELDILPAPKALDGALQPLISVIIGSSTATATYDRTSGKSTSSVDPALVTVKVAATPLTPAIVIPVTLGQTQTIQLPAGLGSITIQVADGSTFHNADGTVGSIANAVKLAVTLLNQPVINLAVAGAQASVAGAPAVMAPPATVNVTAPEAAPPAPTSLPHTGGSPWIPIAGGFVLVAFFATRRVLATAH
jgi:hypothetical protein